MDTDSLFVASTEEIIENIFLSREEMNGLDYFLKTAWKHSSGKQRKKLSLKLAATHTRCTTRATGLFKEEFRCSESVCLCSERIVPMKQRATNFQLSTKTH